MRSPAEMFALFEEIACADERIRAMTLEGSRANPNATSDAWQDYDVTFLVSDVESFTCSDGWLGRFGDIVLMQKPEAMELFPPDFPAGWFSYLMLFSDGVKIDLTLVPREDGEAYFAQDPLIRVLLDKDGLCPDALRPSDKRFWVQRPPSAHVRDCANEFYLSCTYVARGLLRDELLCANWTFEQIVRVELLRMLGYAAGARHGFPLNAGKHDKLLPRLLEPAERELLLGTYRLDSVDAAWKALRAAMDLFEASMTEACEALSYECPNDRPKIDAYLETLKDLR
ncbi:hypothetical protein B5F44_00315 [Gordonibacter urolithinfaciens]|uniref:aminoglycoside 6-adenylyltransferase n=1 Tax=Gordonibacter urolithinfaciens TaxID=1335613 RepID=UPI000B388454|nr:aminoglycoside 6-adenylyltransferase [Gordonibacter urolithinfaciens]OUO89087.1 hypothetical protein B5F44_00315 [Gordonibacter urolithinfaciens]